MTATPNAPVEIPAEPVPSDDHAHVLLDAISAFRRTIDGVKAPAETPWEDYDGADPAEDPKASREGYLRLLAEIEEHIGSVLNGTTPWGGTPAKHPLGDSALRTGLYTGDTELS